MLPPEFSRPHGEIVSTYEKFFSGNLKTFNERFFACFAFKDINWSGMYKYYEL